MTKFVALTPSERGVEVLVLRDDVLDADPFNVVVNGGNAQATALLSYLDEGAFAQARMVSEQVVDLAEQWLHDKPEDPVSAAIGGYYLLRAGQLDKLHDWTNNLANRIKWLPDGCVIDAWHLLRQAKSEPDRARERLLEAENRGLPLLTQGLRLLLDGLSLFHRRENRDTMVGAALERLRRYASAADWSAPTTTFFAHDSPYQPMTPPTPQ